MQRMLVKQVLLLLLLALLPLQLWANTPEQKGLEIAEEIDRRDAGFGDYTSEVTMILKNRHGQESIRHLRRMTLEVQGDGDKEITIFDLPNDVRGTSLLTFSHGLEPDDQWLYLPALKRIKRISSVNKSGPFMGSEFAYEDLTAVQAEKYTYRYLEDEVLDGYDCYVIEDTPAYKYSGYTRRVRWIDKTLYQARKIDYYDRKNVLLKTLVFRDYQQYLHQYWRPNEMFMENNQTGKSTRLIWKNYRFRTGQRERDFSPNRLKQLR